MAGNFVKLYQNHGGAIGYWSAWVGENGIVFVQYSKTLDGKAVRKKYQAFAKNVGRANTTTPYEQGCLEVDSKARLKMDKGYVKTLAEAESPSTNTLGLLKPMLATPMEKIKPEKIDWDNAYAQPKLDGHRALFNDGVLYSRQGKVLDLPHIVKAIEAVGIEDLHLDGELYIHGKSLQEMSKLIKKHRPESLDIEYHIYDQVIDAPFIERIQTLVERFRYCINNTVVPVETIKISNMESLMALHDDYRKKDYEGTMLRFGDEPYRDGKRSRTLLKLKEFQDAEFEIIAVNEGKPYITDVGTFRVPIYTCVVPVNGKTFTVTAPGNMHAKHALWVDSDVTRGRFLTVKFHYYSADGIPQLPIALHFHETV